MIPRLKPHWGPEELAAALKPEADAVERYENDFAAKLSAREAVSASYGRSALWMMIKALGIENAEVVIPAYTCVVVAHAVVLSGNRPRFVDCAHDDYNMELEGFAAAINEHTRMVIPTHIFGYPMDVYAVQEIVRAAEAKYGHKIYVIQDVCHSFNAEWQGTSVTNVGDAALFGSNISKTITSIFGGMLTFNDEALAKQVRSWRDENFASANFAKFLRRIMYLPAAQLAFSRPGFSLVYWLQHNTPLLKGLTDAYHLDDEIHFPPDYQVQLAPIEARVGLVQLKKLKGIIAARRANAQAYTEALDLPPDWIMPPMVAGATYSHYVIRVPDRDACLRRAAKQGVELGQLIEYSVPELPKYQAYRAGQEFPHAAAYSTSLINLPVYAGLRASERRTVIKALQGIATKG